ncbi:MAG: Methionyl-tRNA formyltransferase [Pycnora praestabilis]|nr:MAG: Methionyl-tRNA formyltransferase [Pycnora praestabilis]
MSMRSTLSLDGIFRGPAPLHHTLLAGCKNTGITLQTLHPKHFDHGTILAQTPLPGFSIPVPGASPECFSVAELLHLVAPKGAEMLVQGIRDQVFVEPTVDMGWHQGSEDPPSVRRAPKITSEDSHIDWKTWTSKEILRREAVLGPLWNKFTITSDPSHVHTSRAAMKRIILSGFEHLEAYGKARRGPFQPGVAFTPEASRPGFYVATCDGEMMAINRMKIEGEVEKQALAAHSTLGLV